MSKGKIWVTRTELGAMSSAGAFNLDGFETVIAPLLEVVPPDAMPEPPKGHAVLVLTSRNGVAALDELTDRRDWPVFTVGDATARDARIRGFLNVISAGGTWVELVSLIKQTVPSGTSIVHICGALWRGPIVETLAEAGYQASRTIVYQTVPVDALPISDLSDITHIALYSPRAAEILAGLSPDVGHIKAVSISPATDAALGALNFRARLIAEAPNEDAMIAALGA